MACSKTVERIKLTLRWLHWCMSGPREKKPMQAEALYWLILLDLCACILLYQVCIPLGFLQLFRWYGWVTHTRHYIAVRWRWNTLNPSLGNVTAQMRQYCLELHNASLMHWPSFTCEWFRCLVAWRSSLAPSLPQDILFAVNTCATILRDDLRLSSIHSSILNPLIFPPTSHGEIMMSHE